MHSQEAGEGGGGIGGAQEAGVGPSIPVAPSYNGGLELQVPGRGGRKTQELAAL